jgi:hypothetical protein
MSPELQKLESEIEGYRTQLINHPLYLRLNSVEALRIFMQEHVFAVWDFMSLLKSLQRGLTCVELPWIPKGNPATRRLINEIVLGEESDVDAEGKAASHFELYIEAMSQIGANNQPILNFMDSRVGSNLNIELQDVSIQENTKDFVQFTFGAIRQNELHKLAALFTFGREDLIPSMFIEIVKSIEKETGNSFSKLRYYLERHIEVDGGEHGPMALNMMEELCGTDEQKWKEATLVSVEALKMRIHLWDGVLHAIQTKLPANNH